MKQHWIAFKTAAWLGWQKDSNWTEPWLFAIYSIIKPISATLILVFMYFIAVVATQQSQPGLLAYIYTGNAFYMFVFQGLFGLFEVIQSDREWFQTIRYVYISPISYYVYIVGRAAAQMIIAAMGVAIVLIFGFLVLGLPLTLPLDQVPLFLAILLLGLLCTVSIGLSLAGVSFLTARHGGNMNEGVAGIFYVFCGVVFPLSILPSWGQAIGKAIPLTYWFEGTRRILLPSISSSALYSTSMVEIVAYLSISTAIFFLISVAVFRFAEYMAKKKGIIDMTTAY